MPTPYSVHSDVTSVIIGDHVMNDLAEPTQEAVWRSCAVIKEIGREAKITQSEGYVNVIIFTRHLSHANRPTFIQFTYILVHLLIPIVISRYQTLLRKLLTIEALVAVGQVRGMTSKSCRISPCRLGFPAFICPITPFSTLPLSHSLCVFTLSFSH